MKQFDQSSFIDNFLSHLEKAETGENSSLHWLSVPIQNIKDPDDFEYRISIGGTNVVIYKNDTEITLLKIHSLKSGMELIDKIVSKITPNASSLYISLAFPANQFQTDIGISASVYKSVKDHNFDDIIGKDLAQIFCQKLPNLQKVQIINDVILLLKRNHDRYNTNAGLILGTGFNVGIIKSNCIVNLEAGNFNEFDALETTRIIDRDSINPGQQLLEKETSGRYMFLQYNLMKNERVIDSSNQLASIDDECSRIIWAHTSEIVRCVTIAIERFLSPNPVYWSYEGSVIEHLLESNLSIQGNKI